MSNYLVKTAEKPVAQDKNGKDYKTVTFTEVVMMQTPFGLIQKPANQSRSRNTNRYAESYLDGKEEVGFSDPIFSAKNPAKGGIYQGSIETRNVAPYPITDTRTGEERMVSTYTTLVFGDTDSPAYETLVKAAFKSQNHEIDGSEDPEAIATLVTNEPALAFETTEA